MGATFGPAYKSLGNPQSSDSDGKRELRAELLALVAGLGKDPEAIAEAKATTLHNLSDPAGLDPTFANAALPIASRNGDATLFDQLQKTSLESVNPQSRAVALRALEEFRDPSLEKRALDFAVSGQVRNQDAASFVAHELHTRDTQDLAWQYIQDNWTKVSAQFTTFSGASLVNSAGGFCSVDRADQVSTFFATHKVAASERALSRAKNEIGDCIDLRAAQESNFKSWLSSQFQVFGGKK